MPDATKRLLIVDDEECIRTTLSLVFAELGYQVRTALDGFSALRKIRLENPDILLSDLNMPGMSGFELLSVVRRRFPAILVIAMSGSFCGIEVPSGVPADAFYEKGSSTTRLMQMLKTPPKIRRHALPTSDWMSPLWIQRSASDSLATAQVKITCPECLRAFSHALDGLGSRKREVDCVHCGNLIQFEAVEPSDRMPQQAFRRGTGTPLGAQGLSTFSN
ncbi:MAG TPA: response regulator [Terracidiphilus sp.]|nr:response regulator [Terracidiphilus sp.]